MGMGGGEEKREPFGCVAQGSWGGFREERTPELNPEEFEGAGDRMSQGREENPLPSAQANVLL